LSYHSGMSVAKIIEISSSSTNGFDDAVRIGVERASQTVKNITGAWVQDQQVKVEGGRITEYRVMLKITFILQD
jgi:flavin-binding protein dodecin